MAIGGGVEGGVGTHIIIGDGNCRVVATWWAFREVRIAWRLRADLVQASQFWGLS